MIIKILLVQPTYPSSPLGKGYLPVGLGYLAEAIEKSGIEYEVSNLNFETEDAFFEKIEKYQPEFIGITLMSLDIFFHYDLIRRIKTRHPEIKVVAGGPHISFVKERSFEECPYMDYGVVHEGEVTILELLKGETPSGIKGLIYKNEDGKVVYNGDRPFLTDLDGLSYPMYRKFNMSDYGNSISIASTRGCPFSCIFCGAFLSMGRKWRARSIPLVLEEMMYWYDKGYRHFHFVDSNFFFSQSRVIELCEALGKRDLAISMASDGMRGKDADYEMLVKMKSFGLKLVAIGVESANDDILNTIKKGETLEDLKNCVRMLKDLDIYVLAFFVIGLPGERVRHVLNSFAFALRYPNISKAYFFNPNPLFGTELYDIAKEKNYLRTDDKGIYDNIGGMSKKILLETPELSIRKRLILNRVAQVVSFAIVFRHRVRSIYKQYINRLKNAV